MKKAKIDWKKIKNYKKSVIFTARDKKILPVCILCDRIDNITHRALWVDDTRKRAVFYSLCKDCANELHSEVSEADRQSIILNVIEKKIDAVLSLPHLKINELQKRGFEIVF